MVNIRGGRAGCGHFVWSTRIRNYPFSICAHSKDNPHSVHTHTQKTHCVDRRPPRQSHSVAFVSPISADRNLLFIYHHHRRAPPECERPQKSVYPVGGQCLFVFRFYCRRVRVIIEYDHIWQHMRPYGHMRCSCVCVCCLAVPAQMDAHSNPAELNLIRLSNNMTWLLAQRRALGRLTPKCAARCGFYVDGIVGLWTARHLDRRPSFYAVLNCVTK